MPASGRRAGKVIGSLTLQLPAHLLMDDASRPVQRVCHGENGGVPEIAEISPRGQSCGRKSLKAKKGTSLANAQRMFCAFSRKRRQVSGKVGRDAKLKVWKDACRKEVYADIVANAKSLVLQSLCASGARTRFTEPQGWPENAADVQGVRLTYHDGAPDVTSGIERSSSQKATSRELAKSLARSSPSPTRKIAAGRRCHIDVCIRVDAAGVGAYDGTVRSARSFSPELVRRECVPEGVWRSPQYPA